MWRLALLGLCVTLSGCEFSAWHQLDFVAGQDPYLPRGDSENMRRAMGLPVQVPPIAPEPGQVWPPPPTTEPTLQTLEQQGGQLPNEANPPPVPPGQGSSTPPQPPSPPPTTIPVGPQPAAPAQPNVPPPPVANTPLGPGVLSGGAEGYKTITLPNAQTGIVVPNGNGTSTAIYSNGTVQTIPTPK